MNNPLELLNNSQAGKIVVNSDEWTLSNTGFTQAPDTATFVTNIAKWFTGGRSTGKFHAYSTNFGLTESVLAETLAKAGYTWTVGKNIKIDLPTLLTFDGIFLCGDLADNQVLIDYVKAGGNVYLGGGTGAGGPQAEADQWNTFLNAFGLKFLGVYNEISGNQTINNSHPIFAGVKAIYVNNGNSIVDLDPASQTNQLILTHTSGQGLTAAFAGSEITNILSSRPTQSDQTQTLWQIGYPGQIGKESLRPGGWQEEVTYVIGSDQDPVNKSSMPFLLLKPGLTPKPERQGKPIPSTDKLNIRFTLERNYGEGELILVYDFFGSETDTVFLDGKNLIQILGVGEGKLKQNQISLGALTQGEHTLTITTDGGNGSHWIDYLRLLFKRKSYTYQFRPVAFKVPNGQYLTAENGGGGPLLANRSQIQAWETFRLITLENGKVALQAPLRPQYLSVLPDGNFGWVGHIKEWEMLDLVQLADNKVALKGHHGKYISIQQGGGGTVIANGSEIKDWEILELIELESRVSQQVIITSKQSTRQSSQRQTLSQIVTSEQSTIQSSQTQPIVQIVTSEQSTIQSSQTQPIVQIVTSEQSTIQSSQTQPIVQIITSEESTTQSSQTQPIVQRVTSEESTTQSSQTQPIVQIITSEESTTQSSQTQPIVQIITSEQSTTENSYTSYTYSSRPVAFKVPNGQYLTAENGGGGLLLANRCQIEAWETFRLITLENGKVALQAPLRPEYLSVLPDGNFAWVGHIKEWEMFDLVQLADNKVALKGYHGKYISIQQGGGWTVIANASEIKEWEILELIELESRKSKQKEKKRKEINNQESRRKKRNTIILEFGSQKKDDIRDFTQGRGRFFKKVAKLISELQEAGEIDDDVQPVIAIVRQKKSTKTLWD